METIKEPRAAFAIVWSTYAERAFPPVGDDVPIDQTTRSRLTSLLGKDVRSDLRAWASYYESVAGRLPDPLPRETADETDRIIQAMTAFGAAAGRLQKAELRLAVRRQKVAGGEQGIELAEIYIPKAVSDMAVAQPNWRVRTTDDLVKEVADYSDRVDAALTKYDVDGVSSSTSRSAVRSP